MKTDLRSKVPQNNANIFPWITNAQKLPSWDLRQGLTISCAEILRVHRGVQHSISQPAAISAKKMKFRLGKKKKKKPTHFCLYFHLFYLFWFIKDRGVGEGSAIGTAHPKASLGFLLGPKSVTFLSLLHRKLKAYFMDRVKIPCLKKLCRSSNICDGSTRLQKKKKKKKNFCCWIIRKCSLFLQRTFDWKIRFSDP